jgi:hypothetical protein
MIRRSKTVYGIVFVVAVSAPLAAHGAIAIDQITDINNTPGFGGTGVFSNPPIGVDETAVFMGNDIVVYSLVGGGNNNGAGLTVPVSNGENGITSTEGGANVDIDNEEPAHPVFSTIGNASGKLENGNAIRFSMWMRQDPNDPVTKQPSVEPVVKIELWKEALSGNADFSGAAFPGFGDRIWDTDQNAGQAVHQTAGQSQADWVDMNNNGLIASGQPVAISLVPDEWRRVETTLIVDDDPLDDGFGWSIGADFFDVTAVEEIRAVMFVGDFSGVDNLGDGGSFWVDNLMVEVFANEAAMLATPNPNTAPVEGLPGDANGDGSVDAADWVQLRDSGAAPALIDEWRANFGQPFPGAGGGGLESAAVPEPTSCGLMLLAVVALQLARPRAWGMVRR